MSFLTRTPLLLRAPLASHSARAFSTSLANRKSATDAVKDTVKGVDRAVSDKLVDGIELGRSSSLSYLPYPPILPPIFFSLMIMKRIKADVKIKKQKLRPKKLSKLLACLRAR